MHLLIVHLARYPDWQDGHSGRCDGRPTVLTFATLARRTRISPGPNRRTVAQAMQPKVRKPRQRSARNVA